MCQESNQGPDLKYHTVPTVPRCSQKINFIVAKFKFKGIRSLELCTTKYDITSMADSLPVTDIRQPIFWSGGILYMHENSRMSMKRSPVI